ncbi:cytochrome c family protein [Sphingomonas cavernae]|uniref:Cytochrome c family protein n=2 Tax=Sphingomonas cavernae TaxID=2320861 RepID=A0A418W866_9SPHN|nr:cytochrome c family protein [Sphingomonas cavernae]
MALFVAFGGGWMADRLVGVSYPDAPAYKPADLDQPVDLAALQRSWPAGLTAPGDHNRLAGYLRAVDRGAIPPPAAGAAAAVPAAPPPDLGTLLASADPARGKSVAGVCASCHTFDQGGADRTGPNLWGVVGRDVASHSGFAYSPAIGTHPGNWTYEELDRYLASPARAIPGNKMAFAGIRRPQDRANLLAYLGSLGSAGVPKPAPKAEPAAGAGGD